jgi:hypothetical protein
MGVDHPVQDTHRSPDQDVLIWPVDGGQAEADSPKAQT